MMNNSRHFLSKTRAEGRLPRGNTLDALSSVDWPRHPLGPIEGWPAELKSSLNVILNSKQPMCVLWGPDLFQFYNEACAAIYGEEKHKLAMGRPLGENFPAALELLRPSLAMVLEGHSCLEENSLMPISAKGRSQDESFTYSLSPILSEADTIDGVLCIFTETTTLEIAKQDAEKANELKSAFLANTSHEIRTPLGAIIGFAELLKDDTLTAKERQHYLDVIIRSGHALTKIIDDILDLSKVEAGKLSIEKAPICLRYVIAETIAMFRDRAVSKSIDLRIDDSQLPNFLVNSDPSRIRQILLNLVGNAMKFTSKGTITVGGRYSELVGDSVRVVITVTDTGIGLTPETAKKLFMPFMQGDSGDTRKYGGTGLGLALSKKLGQALGGDVLIERCRPGEGCTFAFELIAQKTRPGQSPTLDDIELIGEKPLQGLKILVVDDVSDNRHLFKVFLNREGALVDVAPDGESGISMAQTHDYDAVLMDIEMPGLSGYDALARLKQNDYRKPVIALTAHALVEERTRALQAGFDDHVSKPVNPRRLVGSILKRVRH